MTNDEKWMSLAIKQAIKAEKEGEVPIGAILVQEGLLIAKAYNQPVTKNDATAHAEMQAFTSASDYLGGKYLNECTLYVTLEPCVMCGGASFWTQIKRIVYGASDEKRGFSTIEESILHPKTEITKGIHEEKCSEILHKFFQNKRT